MQRGISAGNGLAFKFSGRGTGVVSRYRVLHTCRGNHHSVAPTLDCSPYQSPSLSQRLLLFGSSPLRFLWIVLLASARRKAAGPACSFGLFAMAASRGPRQGPEKPHKQKISHSGSQAQYKGIAEIMVCRILLFMWPFGPYQSILVTACSVYFGIDILLWAWS